MITGKNYIGNLLSSIGQKTFTTFNPVTNKENETVFYEASQLEIEESLSLANRAFKKYQLVSGNEKFSFLNEIAIEIEKLGDELIHTYCTESGLTKERAISERQRTIFQLHSFANLVKEGSWVEASIDTAIENRKPIPKNDIRKMFFPIGPIAVFGASNFPLAYSTAGGDTVSALAAGCPVIVKSHPMHAGTSELIAFAIIQAAEKTGMPNGIFSNLNSSDHKIGTYLVKHSTIKAVGFTGSFKGGKALCNLASKRNEPIPVFAEMGSVNPVILLTKAAGSKGKYWAKKYAQSITTGSGQFCTKPGLIIGVKDEALKNFTQLLSEEISKIEPSCMLHPDILNAYDNNKLEIINSKNVTSIVKSKKEIPTNNGNHALVTVDGDTFLKNKNLHQEVFGPFSLIVQCTDLNQLEKIISQLDGQLTGTILADENELIESQNIINTLKQKVGRLIFNDVPTGVEVCNSMVHGGPYPASTDSRFTAVGVNSIKRWVRPVCYQNWPNHMLPAELKNDNPLKISRSINGSNNKKSIT